MQAAFEEGFLLLYVCPGSPATLLETTPGKTLAQLALKLAQFADLREVDLHSRGTDVCAFSANIYNTQASDSLGCHACLPTHFRNRSGTLALRLF
mmetsp:Transcript_32386/g.106892  ORF Transcript_32386/g.106892 Transcript_32386/m.106892 type:complete len:95 (+) Transcript_32386:1-285(+)